MSTETRKYELKARAERQEETRRRIVQATMELHEEVGPARTSVSEIARRAGVQRLTVYNHFPDESELIASCSGSYMAEHPFPALDDAFKLEEPGERVRTVLGRVYGWYRGTEAMIGKIQRDRLLVPVIEDQAAATIDVRLAELASALQKGFGARGRRAERVRALVRLALDFWSWRRLKMEGLGDPAAAELMSEAIVALVRK